MHRNRQNDAGSSRIDLIRVVKSPLNFFVLIVLVVEGGLGTIAVRSPGNGVTIAYLMTWVILALIAAVVILTFTRPWTLFAVGDSQRLAQNNDFCRQIAGEWVDQVEGSGSRELGSVEYIHDSNAGTIIIKGQSYSRDGGFDAKWHSITSHVNAQDRTLSYIWEGSHNARGETFKGFGKISFLQSLKEARGEFWDIDAATLTLVSKSSRLYKSKGALRSYDAAGVEEAWEQQVARRKPDSINSSRA